MTPSDPSVLRAAHLVSELGRPEHSTERRLMFWRLLRDCAMDGFEKEVQQLDALKVPMADPELLATYGEPIV
jgi:hypothetical protein